MNPENELQQEESYIKITKRPEDNLTPEQKEAIILRNTTKKQRRDALRTRPVEESSTIGRNDPCMCGSGKKSKKCCG